MRMSPSTPSNPESSAWSFAPIRVALRDARGVTIRAVRLVQLERA
jgi:hypothetical protein